MDLSFKLIITFLLPLLAVLASILIGQRYGRYRAGRSAAADPGTVSSAVTAAFGLSAFMIAFTFQIAADRYDQRRELLVKEADHIRTAFLRAELLNEPIKSQTKKLLIEFVNLRVDISPDSSEFRRLDTRSQQILDSCWSFTVALAQEDRSSEVYALYTSSINDLFSSYNERLAVTFAYDIPSAIFWVLGIITILSMLALGYQFGIAGKGSIRINLLLAVVYAVVMSLIIVLDHPATGLVKINQQPLLKLQKELIEAGK